MLRAEIACAHAADLLVAGEQEPRFRLRLPIYGIQGVDPAPVVPPDSLRGHEHPSIVRPADLLYRLWMDRVEVRHQEHRGLSLDQDVAVPAHVCAPFID